MQMLAVRTWTPPTRQQNHCCAAKAQREQGAATAIEKLKLYIITIEAAPTQHGLHVEESRWNTWNMRRSDCRSH